VTHDPFAVNGGGVTGLVRSPFDTTTSVVATTSVSEEGS
jgi:hypothetical protein